MSNPLDNDNAQNAAAIQAAASLAAAVIARGTGPADLDVAAGIFFKFLNKITGNTDIKKIHFNSHV
ncbi:hypothetical protein [Azospirillum sp. B4]|uniref:hypothetical protein n=1 Tax=Azospirillum sp. B4 TaxID=95605 RepID=UPI00034D0379|nr:hypothetical protein [Azospirillum sp. B4]